MMIALALLASSLAPFDPYEVHVRYKYANPGAVVEETGQRFWLGADQLGRGTLSRLLYGARVSLYVSIVLLLPASARMVFATANLGDAVVVEAALSFLGVGTPPDVPSWGGMLSITDQKYIEVSLWLVFFPSLAVSIAVFGFNFLGDGLRDTLDPRLRGLQER